MGKCRDYKTSWKYLGGFYYDVIYFVTQESDEDSCTLPTEFYVIDPSLFLLGFHRQAHREFVPPHKVMAGQLQHPSAWVRTWAPSHTSCLTLSKLLHSLGLSFLTSKESAIIEPISQGYSDVKRADLAKSLEDSPTESRLAFTCCVSYSLIFLHLWPVKYLKSRNPFSLFLHHALQCLLFGQFSVNVCRMN